MNIHKFTGIDRCYKNEDKAYGIVLRKQIRLADIYPLEQQVAVLEAEFTNNDAKIARLKAILENKYVFYSLSYKNIGANIILLLFSTTLF